MASRFKILYQVEGVDRRTNANAMAPEDRAFFAKERALLMNIRNNSKEKK